MPSHFLKTLSFLAVLASPAIAEMTQWMLPADLDRYIARKLTGGVHYPNKIDCGAINGLAYVRIATTSHKGVPPYLEWRWHMGPQATLTADIAALPRDTAPDRHFEIVSESRFDLGAEPMTCVLLQR